MCSCSDELHNFRIFETPLHSWSTVQGDGRHDDTQHQVIVHVEDEGLGAGVHAHFSDGGQAVCCNVQDPEDDEDADDNDSHLSWNKVLLSLVCLAVHCTVSLLLLAI